jgi:putative redox protein
MGVMIHGEYLGGLAMRMKHGPSGSEVQTDPPVDNGGTGSAFSPTDLVATALGSCMMSVLALHARKAGWDLSGMKINVEKNMTASLPRKIAQLKVELHLPSDLNAEQRNLAREIAENCPVALSIADSIEMPLIIK